MSAQRLSLKYAHKICVDLHYWLEPWAETWLFAVRGRHVCTPKFQVFEVFACIKSSQRRLSLYEVIDVIAGNSIIELVLPNKYLNFLHFGFSPKRTFAHPTAFHTFAIVFDRDDWDPSFVFMDPNSIVNLKVVSIRSGQYACKALPVSHFEL